MEHHGKESMSQNILGIISEVIEKHDLVGKPADPESDAQKRMIAEISHRVAASVFNMPYEEALSVDELSRLLERSANRPKR
jgi:hypothetical protein